MLVIVVNTKNWPRELATTVNDSPTMTRIRLIEKPPADS